MKQSKWEEALDLLDESVLLAACTQPRRSGLTIAKSPSKTNENMTVLFWVEKTDCRLVRH